MSAQNYKLNKRVRSEKYSETLIGRCTKNNYKCIVTLYIAIVNSLQFYIYRYFLKHTRINDLLQRSDCGRVGHIFKEKCGCNLIIVTSICVGVNDLSEEIP